MPACRWTDEEVAVLHERARSGESLRSLAKEADADVSNLSRLLRRRFAYQVPEERLRGTKPQSITAPTRPVDIGYMAGLMDGEGSIMVRRVRNAPAVFIRVSMTDERAIRWLAGFGGAVTEYLPDPPRKRVFTWQVFRQADIAALLPVLLPHLIVKRAKAEEALAEVRSRRRAII